MPFALITLGLCFTAIGPTAAAAESDPAAALVTVNGDDITNASLQLEYLSRQIPEDQQEQYRDRILHELVDRRLIQQFLAKRKIEVPARDVENQVETLRRVVAATDGDFDAAITAMGFTPESLREHLSLPLAWKIYVRKTVTDQQFRDEFNQHRDRYDGTEVRASQIVIAIPRDALEDDWTAAEQKLADVRTAIEDGTLTFADAARQHSTSPSGEEGGDLGFFGYRGRLPEAVAAQAFELEVGELSPVFRSPFGVHLLTVTERSAGDLSLEDVREKVLDDISARMWAEQAAVERKKSRIDWHIEVDPPDGSER
jgi:parvulin-like peptidyl-prolyl isomerase